MSQRDVLANTGPHIQGALMGYNGIEKLSPSDFMTIITSQFNVSPTRLW